jgi:hypothetical protein
VDAAVDSPGGESGDVASTSSSSSTIIMSKSSLTLEADFALGGERRRGLWRSSIDLVGVRLRRGMDAARLVVVAVVAVELTMGVGFILVGEGARGVDICTLVGEGERGGDILEKGKTADSGAGDGVLTPSVLDFPNTGRLSRFGVGVLIFGLAAVMASPTLKLRERKMLNRLLGLDVGAETGGGLVVVREGVLARASFSFRFCFFTGRSSISTDWVDWVDWVEACLAADSAGDAGMVITVAAGADGLAGCMVGKDTAARAFGP